MKKKIQEKAIELDELTTIQQELYDLGVPLETILSNTEEENEALLFEKDPGNKHLPGTEEDDDYSGKEEPLKQYVEEINFLAPHLISVTAQVAEKKFNEMKKSHIIVICCKNCYEGNTLNDFMDRLEEVFGEENVILIEQSSFSNFDFNEALQERNVFFKVKKFYAYIGDSFYTSDFGEKPVISKHLKKQLSESGLIKGYSLSKALQETSI